MGVVFFSQDATLGSQSVVYMAVSEEVEGMTGQYIVDCKVLYNMFY